MKGHSFSMILDQIMTFLNKNISLFPSLSLFFLNQMNRYEIIYVDVSHIRSYSKPGILPICFLNHSK